MKRASIFAALLLLALALAGTAVAQSATVMTDQADYAPGTIVTITGSGWQPGETVTLQLVESPLIDTPPTMIAVADANGNIFNNQFSPDRYDLNITFTLTATGGSSGLQAQTTFTDGTPKLSVTATGPTGSGTVTSADTFINCAAAPGGNNSVTGCQHTYGANFSTTLTATANNGYYFASWSGTGGCTGTSTTCAASETGNITFAATATFASGTSTTLAVAAATGTYGGTTTLSATLKAGSTALNNQTVSFTLNGTSVGSTTTNSSGVATLNSVSLSGINAGTYPTGVGSSFAGANPYGASSGTNSLTVNQASSSTSVALTAGSNPSTFGSSLTFQATVTGTGATGTVAFWDQASGATCSSLLTSTQIGSTQTLSGGTASVSTTTLAVGSHTILACYSGDTNFNSSSGTVSQTVNAATARRGQVIVASLSLKDRGTLIGAAAGESEE